MKKILIALPKGRILEDLIPILKRANLEIEDSFFDKASRKLIFATNFPDIEVVRVRSFDVATFVKSGAADIGVCGLDVLEEFKSLEIFPVLNLGIGKCRLSIAAKKDDHIDLEKINNTKIATKYPNITKEFFAKKSIQAQIIKLNGAIEIAPKLNLSNLIVDLVSSGKTLEENEMVEIKKLLEVESYLVVNRSSLKTKNNIITKLISDFDAAI
ncbi:MAG: ATP phosphoribosyltransferase [Rickettsiales bacterium]|nr:ATP phosphoribosyltransferase [Rickettsiales bacterium]